MSVSVTEVVVNQGRRRLTGMLQGMFSQLFGIAVEELDVHATFLDMGADSLSLLRVSQVLQEKFSVKIPFRSLLEELSTIDEVAAHIEQTHPLETQPQEQATPEATE